MTRIHRTALVEHSAEQMFDLVNDIEQYPKFMPGCSEAKILSFSESEMIGELCLSKAGITQRFTTRNDLQRPSSIVLHLVEGNFSAFEARWEFVELTANACKVSLEMNFEFNSSIVGFAAEKLFASVANNLVDTLVKRAQTVYAGQ